MAETKTSWRMTAWVAGVFLLLVGAAMVFSDIRIRRDDPRKSAKLKEYKDKLRSGPNDEKLKSDIRQFDLDLRTRYLRHLSKRESGVYLLLAAGVLFVVAVKRSRQPQPPMPGRMREPSSAASHGPRWFVAGTGVAIGIVLFAGSFAVTTAVPRRTSEIEKLLGTGTPELANTDTFSLEEARRNWPRFRGIGGSGVTPFTNIPTAWDGKAGSTVIWKISAPAQGYSSPMIWRDRLFLSAATDNECVVYSFDVATGRTVWQQTVKDAATNFKSAAQGIPMASCATATMATDGVRVYAFFGTGDLVAFSNEGKPVWLKALGPLQNAYGHAASLTTVGEKLILQLDQGEADAGKSKLYAFHGRTGQILWQRPRRVGSSWATPIVIEPDGKAQIITVAVPWLVANSAADGTELWRVEGFNGEITPSPVFAGGLIFAVSPSEKLFAIQPDGSGNVTKSKVVWTTEENVPDITSPVCDGELLFTLTTSGTLSCFNASDGKKVWEHDFAIEFHSSPAMAGGRLYLFSRKGTAIIVEAKRQFKELFRTSMEDAFDASPAFAEGRIFLRGQTNIWCIGPAEQKLAKQ